MSSHFFISYSHIDISKVTLLSNIFYEYGLNLWVDRRSLIGGTVFPSEIHTAIANCSALFLVATGDALKSQEVKKEYDYAISINKPIFIISFPDTVIPSYLKEFPSIPYDIVTRDEHYDFIYNLFLAGLIADSGTFNPYLVLAKVLHRQAERHWNIYTESRMQRIIGFILSLTLIFDLSSARDIFQSLRALRFPGMAVVTPDGFVIRKRLATYERGKSSHFRFAHEYIGFDDMATIEVQSLNLFSARLSYTAKKDFIKSIILKRSFGRPFRISRKVIKSFHSYQEKHQLRHISRPIGGADQLSSALPNSAVSQTNHKLTIFISKRDRPLANQIAKRFHVISNITIVETNNLAKDFKFQDHIGTALLLVDSNFAITEELSTVIKKIVASNQGLIQITTSPHSVVPEPYLQWIDFSSRKRYTMGFLHLEYTLFSNGLFANIDTKKFLPTFITSLAIFGRPDFVIYTVSKRFYRFDYQAYIFLTISLIPLMLTTGFGWLVIGGPLLLLLSLHSWKFEAAVKPLIEETAVPEIAIITRNGAVFKWRRPLRFTKIEREVNLDFEKLRFIKIINLPFFPGIIFYANKKEPRPFRIFRLSTRRFDTDSITKTLALRWDAFLDSSWKV